ncbi:MAG: DUF1549 domain-containing protein [Bryobacteraceae bacterium]|nr:DUF1549 domain-containing protein [Bryobacteraceae bacterium]
MHFLRALSVFALAFTVLPAQTQEAWAILKSRCASCHNANLASGGLRVDTRDALVLKSVVPGRSASSPLLQRITGEKQPRMPLGAPPLPQAEVAAIRSWIDSGAPAPAAASTWEAKLGLAGPARSIDSVLGIGSTGLVGDSVYARRVYLDLWGVPPSPAQLDSFLRDKSPGKRAALVRELLAGRKQFAENWVSFWNDLLHNDEGVTYIGDRKSITTWLLATLEKNKPYSQMVRELIDPPANMGSEGFIVGVNWRGDVNASQVPVMQAAQNSSQVFLGVNLKCNSCHDSFISKWKLKDAYGMASFFSEKPLELVRCDNKTGVMSTPRFLFPELGEMPRGNDATLAERRRVAADLFTKRENGRLPRTLVNRVWARLMGRGIVEPADDMDAEPWNPALLDALSVDFVEHGYDIDWLLTTILTSNAYQLPAVALPPGEKRYVFRGPLHRRLTAEQFVDSVSALTGEWRVLSGAKPQPGVYARDWRFKPSSLSGALGRPARDLAVTERLNDPTTLQMLELVNGETLSTTLRDGARRMLGQLPAQPPAPLWDSGVITNATATVDLDITGIDKLRLLVVDRDSYDPLRVKAGWIEDPASPLPGINGEITLKDAKAPAKAVLVKLPTEIDLDVKGQTRFKAKAGSDASTQVSDIAPKVRFLIFRGDVQPEMKALTGVTGEPPFTGVPPDTDQVRLILRLFRHALSRDPAPKEREVAMQILRGQKDPAAGLEDLLWSLVLSPEFQYVQ